MKFESVSLAKLKAASGARKAYRSTWGLEKMSIGERRQDARYETETGIMITAGNLEISATLIDISDAGIGVTAEKAIDPGTVVYVALRYIDDYSIQGIVKWSYLHSADDKNLYRMGISAECIILNDDMAVCFPESAELMRKIKLVAIKSKNKTAPGPSPSPRNGILTDD